jgi:hypothetical protein
MSLSIFTKPYYRLIFSVFPYTNFFNRTNYIYYF